MKDKLRFIWSGLWSFLQPLVVALLSQAGILLVEAAGEAVAAVEAMPGATGAEKRAEAFKIITNIMMTRGYKLSAPIIYAAIEVAVVRMQSEK